VFLSDTAKLLITIQVILANRWSYYSVQDSYI